jgi:molybdate transport system substrate-binding protein
MPGRTLALLALLLPLAACAHDDEGVASATLSCATSLRRVMPELAAAYRARAPGVELHMAYGGSGTLRRQVEAGAPVGGVIFASAEDVDRLIATGLAEASSRTVLARNELVLIGPTGSPAVTFATLADLPDAERIAIGDPLAVPAGRYGKEALEKLGVWQALHDRLLPTRDVAGVVAYVRRGEAAAGIAYATEVAGHRDIRILDRAAGDWAPRPVVVGAASVDGPGADLVRSFLTWLASEPARPIWARHGFLGP